MPNRIARSSDGGPLIFLLRERNTIVNVHGGARAKTADQTGRVNRSNAYSCLGTCRVQLVGNNACNAYQSNAKQSIATR